VHRKERHIMNDNSKALVTGATSGLGFESAAQLAEQGWGTVTITGRTSEKVEAARQRLVERTGRDVFDTLAVDLNKSLTVDAAARELAHRGESFDFVLLNAGIAPGGEYITTDSGAEITFASSLIGHHQLTMQMLADGLLADDARIVIAGSEAARGDVPTFKPTNLPSLAEADFDGDLQAAAEELIHTGAPKKYKPATAYANAKLFVAWWASELSERLPAGMTVNAVSPGSVPETQASRNASFFMKTFLLPVFKYAPKSMGMSAPVSEGAARYLEVASYSDDVTGRFYASAPKKMTGPIEVMDYPHFHDEDSQKAAWNAVVKVAGGVDYPVNA
jgi:NAD(P)-dependent dehydrogenase (short-subunit alcohol dehydrogenase family)